MIRRPALQGYACLYDKAFQHHGQINLFSVGCFTSSLYNSNHAKSVLLDHDPKKVVGSAGLEFANTLDGLAFRFPLEGVERAADIDNYIDSASKACVSVGCEIEESEEREIAGYKVRFITKARLHEISLVGEGAVPSTFAEIVSLGDVSDLWSEARKPSFRTSMSVTTARARLHRIANALQRLGD